MNFDAYRRWSVVRSKGMIFYSIVQTSKYMFFAVLITTAMILLFSDSHLAEVGFKIGQMKIWLMIALPIWFGTVVYWFIQERRYRHARRRHMDYVMKYD